MNTSTMTIIEGLLHSEGWLDLERPAYMEAESYHGSADPEAAEAALLT